MKNKPLINQATNQQLEQYISSPSGSLLLSGLRGAGKKFLAVYVAQRLLDGGEELLAKGRIMIVPTGAGIEEIREIIKEISIKALSPRVVIINDADKLGHEAQNALLKSLEELPANTFFILTSSASNKLLATIKSRAATIVVKPVALDEASSAYTESSALEIERAWLLGEGLAAQLDGILFGESSELKTAADAAKDFLGLDSYHRLIFMEKYSSDREGLINFLNGLKRILKAVSLVNAQKGNASAINRLTSSRRTIIELIDAANANASTKLISLDLATSLKV